MPPAEQSAPSASGLSHGYSSRCTLAGAAIAGGHESQGDPSISAWLQLSREANQVATHSQHSSESGPHARRPAMHEGAPPRCISG